MHFPRKITLARIASHDFNRALRIWRARISEKDIIVALVNERSRSLALAIRGLGIATIGTLWLASAKSTLVLKIAFIDLTIPAAYVVFVVAVSLFGAVGNAVSYLMINDFVRVAANKLFKFDSPWALTALQDGAAIWSNTVINQFRFFESSKAHVILGKAVLWLVNVPVLAIICMIYWIEVSTFIKVLRQDGPLSFNSAFVTVALLLLVWSLVYPILLQIPFSFTKNTRFIRWNFLTPIYRRMGLWHPRTPYWIKTTQ
jgi:hypothetical protein